MTDEQLERIKDYSKILNNSIIDNELLDFVSKEIIDRVLIYLNDDFLDPKLERIIARIISSVYADSNDSITDGKTEHEISSISDNGQSISYSDKIKSYLVSSDDTELFKGFTKLLAPYRRVNVASRKFHKPNI